MQLIRVICLLLCCSAVPIAFAAECETYKPHEAENSRRCECGTDLDKLKIQIPSGFKLYAVCNLFFEETTPVVLKGSKANYSDSIGGSFYFVGDSVISGMIKKGEEIDRGNLYFYPDQKAAKSLYREIGFEDSAADRRFGSTELSAGWTEQHWCAPATIRIRRMYLYEWSSEKSGAYALDYDVLKVGKLSRCDHS